MSKSPQMSLEQIHQFLKQEFPQTTVHVDSVGYREAEARQHAGPEHLRPGGTVSGPSLMTLADVTMYVAILATLGPVALAVTTSLTANFLRKPVADADILAKASLMKVGKRLVVGQVDLFSEGDEEPVAHVVATYSVPPTA